MLLSINVKHVGKGGMYDYRFVVGRSIERILEERKETCEREANRSISSKFFYFQYVIISENISSLFKIGKVKKIRLYSLKTNDYS